jgi:hypothetical protein
LPGGVARTTAGGFARGRCRDTEDYDGQSMIALSKNPVLHARSKHIKTRYHFIRECEVALESVGAADQLVDILTKPFARVRFEELRGRIGVIKLTSH